VHVMAASMARDQGKLAEAAGQLRLAVVQSPEDAGLLVKYADAAFSAGRIESAAEALADAARLAPQYPGLADVRRRIEERRRSALGRSPSYGDLVGGAAP